MLHSDGGHTPDLVETFSAVQELLLSTHNVESFLDELATLAAAVVEPPAGVGITVRRDSAPFSVAISDERAARLDETQYDIDDGPCLAALRTGAAVEVEDQRSDRRWGPYAARAAEQGVRSSLSIPLLVDGATVGALNIYNFAKPYAFDRRQRQYAEIFAAQACTALTLVMRQAQQLQVSEQLEQALTSRTVIDQAIGVLMGQQRCTAEEAFALLRKHSQNTNRKLRDVAADVITRVSGQPPGESRGFQVTNAEPASRDRRPRA